MANIALAGQAQRVGQGGVNVSTFKGLLQLGVSSLGPVTRAHDAYHRVHPGAGWSELPPLHVAPPVAQTACPGPQAHITNQLHQVDLVGPRDRTGNKTVVLLCHLQGCL